MNRRVTVGLILSTFAIVLFLFAQGLPDLTVSAISTATVNTDSQTLAINGTLSTTI